MTHWDIGSDEEWSKVRAVCRAGFLSSFHYAVATVDAQGRPHVSPIGSVKLNRDRTGFFFEIFAQRTSRNLDTNPALTILAVNSGRVFWLRSLWKGQFLQPPGTRLLATAGPSREAKPEEIQWWRKVVRPARFLKGHDLLWGDDLLAHTRVRDFTVHEAQPLRLGAMTHP